MKRRLVLTVMVMCSLALFAQQRTKIIDGVYLVRYGNTAVVEDDINKMTWNLSVTVEEAGDGMGRKIGEYVYTFACGNKYTRNLTKFALHGAIVAGLTSATVGAGAITAEAAAIIAMTFYDDVCDYYKNYMR